MPVSTATLPASCICHILWWWYVVLCVRHEWL